jgi:hypothetical protein
MTLDVDNAPQDHFNFTNILQHTGRLVNLAEVYNAFKNGHGSDARLAVKTAKQYFLQRKAKEVLQDAMHEVSNNKNTESALASVLYRLQSVLKEGMDDDGDATRAFREPLPKKIGEFRSRFMNDLFGGLYSHVNAVVSSPLGRGKTTNAVTFLHESLPIAYNLGRKMILISGEWKRSYYVGRLLRAQGFMQSDIERYNEFGDDGSETSISMKAWIEYIGECIKFFDHHSLELGKIQHLVHLHKPIATVIDFLSTVRITPRKGQSDASAMDVLVYSLEDLSNDMACMILSFSQMSNQQITEFDKYGKLTSFGGKGSGGIGEAARIGITQGRTDRLDCQGRPCGAFFHRMKCTVPGLSPDPSYRVEAVYDYERMVYTDFAERQINL